MAEIPVNGEVLKWARDFRGLSLDEAAERLDLTTSDLIAFENGTRKPSLRKFRRFGTTYRLPLSTLFRSTKPNVPKEPRDFRTVGGLFPATKL